MLPHRPLLIILRVMAAGSSYTTHCSKMPQQVPQNQSSPVMNRFCFQLGLTRHSTARPIPAPEHSPAKKLPKVIAPPIYSWASSTLAPQLGTRPISAAIMGWKMPRLPRNVAAESAPTKPKISPMIKLNTKMNTKISSV